MKCVNCGKELKEGAKFCNSCGSEVEKNTSATSSAKVYTPNIFVCIIVAAIVIVILGMLITSIDFKSKIKMETSSEDYVEVAFYQDVAKEFRDMGFTDVEAIGAEDLVLGIIKSAHIVKEITIDGEDSFEKGDKFPEDAEVRIYYHSYKE